MFLAGKERVNEILRWDVSPKLKKMKNYPCPHHIPVCNVTQPDIILEAIRYIDSLQHKLVHKVEKGEIVRILGPQSEENVGRGEDD